MGKQGKGVIRSTKIKKEIVKLYISPPFAKLLKVTESTMLIFCNNGLQGSALIK